MRREFLWCLAQEIERLAKSNGVMVAESADIAPVFDRYCIAAIENLAQ